MNTMFAYICIAYQSGAMIKPYPVNIDLCVLIPCYNNFRGLVQSVNSIDYNRQKLLIVIVDDGSAESITVEKVKAHITAGTHFHIVQTEYNLGITRALNKGLEFIYTNVAARFIARLDCGDICATDRFYKQIAFLELNPGIDLLGTWCYFRDVHSGAAYSYVTPTRHKHIRRSMNFRNVFIHPTVMWRCSAMEEFKYPEQYPHAEDYGLFYDMISERKSAILNEFLVTCEINAKGISVHNRAIQLNSRLKVISHYGKNKFYFSLGALKLWLLMKIPYQFIFFTKKNLYKA